jgi:hypothetical protein
MSQTSSQHDNPLTRARAELEEEHRGLRGLVGQLREAADPTAAAAILDELHGKLKAHFEHEEFPGGLYASMGALGPRHAEEIRDLVDQHFLLLAAVRGLADQARRAPADATPEILHDAVAISDRLRVHEDKEHRLARAIEHGE